GLALGKPVTVLRAACGPPVRQRVDAVLGSHVARIVTYPATTSLIIWQHRGCYTSPGGIPLCSNMSRSM
ncbi:MAG: hypothetical protein WAW17_09030, partial [Rhodococcus sp. (in: high G+C Gram-positive bacteria)]